jgi:hypothetical protein
MMCLLLYIVHLENLLDSERYAFMCALMRLTELL